MESLEPQNPSAAPPGQSGDEPDDSGPRFPVIVLAAPGCIFLLFVIMADALASSLQSVRLAMIVALVAAAGAIGAFAIIAAKSPERHLQIGAGVAIGASIFALAHALLQLT